MNHKLNLELPENLEIYREKIEATIKPYLQIELTQQDKPDWWDSKFGGLPYLPKSYEYPKNSQGEYLYLLAQINFAQTPELKDFPDRGILQFYILADETYGKKFPSLESFENVQQNILLMTQQDKLQEFLESFAKDNLFRNTQQDNFRVIYFPEISFNLDDILTDFSFLPPIKDYYFPIEKGCCAIDFSYQISPIGFRDYQFNIFDSDKQDENIDQQPDEETYSKFFPCNGHKIGGYPHFTQDDPRYLLEEDEDPYILLFQMVSQDNKSIYIMWGDCGVANFFIKKSALKRLDFSQVLYNWDCG